METNIHELLKINDQDRSASWEESFLKLFPQTNLNILNDVPQMGPDNFPYLLVEISSGDGEPATNVFKWLSERGIGLVVNPEEKFPDYIFSYGMIWHYIQTGQFFKNEVVPTENEMIIPPNSTFYVGKPSESFLPETVRTLMKQFLQDQGVMKPKITMVSKDNKNFDLCFSQESFGNPKPEEHMGILQALSWFLPNHYSLALISETEIPDFHTL